MKYTLTRSREWCGVSEEERAEKLQKTFAEKMTMQGPLVTCGEITGTAGILKQEMLFEGRFEVPLLKIQDTDLPDIWTMTCGGETDIWEPVKSMRLFDRFREEK